MSLFSRLFDAVHSWHRRRDGRKTPSRVRVELEQLDHRQLLSVNFTGNVATDFPATQTPGVVVLPDNPSVTHPTIGDPSNPNDPLRQLVKVSGFDISGLRVTYTSADDTLSIGIEQPLSQQPSHPGPVVAGDADNNGDDGTVNPAVAALEGDSFKDYPDFGGSEYMGVGLDLNGTGYADVVAGYAVNDTRTPKEYQVAQAVVDKSLPPTVLPDFGTELPQYEGNVYKVNSPAHPNLEFSITHFSQLYLAETGKALTPDTTIKLEAFAGSGDDTGIGEAYFPEQPVNIGLATPPTMTCPPASPPVVINYHEQKHIDTVHDTLVRVNVLGSSGFDVTKIDPATVTLGGAHPVASFDRFINNDEWPDATFVFRGPDITLPAGWSEATVTGDLTNGTTFSSSVRVHNNSPSDYSAAAVLGAQERQLARATRRDGFTVLPSGSPLAAASAGLLALQRKAARDARVYGFTVLPDGSPVAAAAVAAESTRAVSIPGLTTPAVPLKVDMTVPTSHPAATSKPSAVVKIERREPTVAGAGKSGASAKVPLKVRASLARFVRHAGAVDLNTNTPVATGAS